MAIQDEIPKSRLTLRYKTEIEGQPEDLSLPMRSLITGDFSLGSSKDRKADLEERRVRNMDGRNTDAIMKDMDIGLNFSVANQIDPENNEDIDVQIPIDSMKAFSPDQIAKNVPKIKGLLMLKELLEEVISNVDNRKDFRKLLSELMGNEEALSKMMEQLKSYESLKLPGTDES